MERGQIPKVISFVPKFVKIDFKLVVAGKTYESRYFSGNILCASDRTVDLFAAIENDMEYGYGFCLLYKDNPVLDFSEFFQKSAIYH